MEPALHDDDETLKKRLLARIAVAGAVVVALIGALTVFDGFVVEEKRPSKSAAVRPIAPPPPTPESGQAVEEKPSEEKPAESRPAEEKQEVAAAVPGMPEPPGAMAQPAMPEATKPEAARRPPERPLTVPATPRPALMRPSEPVAVAPSRPEPAKEIARVLPAPDQRPAIASQPIARAMESARQFVLQMGVFNSVANAEELRAKLELAGVAAQIEARVQVGPFASREEAERTREKLRALGLEPGVIVAARK